MIWKTLTVAEMSFIAEYCRILIILKLEARHKGQVLHRHISTDMTPAWHDRYGWNSREQSTI